MSTLKKYTLSAEVTISLHAVVYAKSKKHALELGGDLGMPTIHEDSRYNNSDESDEEWRTSGELDGEAMAIEAELEKP